MRLLAASTNTPALSVQQKLQKGQRNTAKINKNNNDKKNSTTFARKKINTGVKNTGRRRKARE